MFEKIRINENDLKELKAKDSRMKMLIDTIGEVNREGIQNPFIALVHSIVFQQLAFQAANTIWNRIINTVDVTPETILNIDDEVLKNCGLSSTKVVYIKNIAIAVQKGELDFNSFHEMSDQQIIDELIKIKGIGVWTAEMFLTFCLNRKDVMSYNDLAIIKGLKWLYRLNNKPTIEQFNKYKKRFSPFNTIASFYLWEITIRNYFQYDGIENVKITNGVTYYDSPLGLLEIQSDNGVLISLEFIDQKRYEETIEPVLISAKNQLDEYFKGSRFEFNLPIRTKGTEFQNKVWNELTKVTYAKTATYKDIAIGIGNDKASRAVGNANNKNKIPIIIPCHRVVGSNGKLVGYEGGLWRKEWLLKHERTIAKENYEV